MEIRSVLAARRRWLERPGVRFARVVVFTICAVTFLLNTVLRLVTREGHWLLMSIFYAWIALGFASEAGRARAPKRRQPGGAGTGQVDGPADKTDSISDGVDHGRHVEGYVRW